MKNLSSSTEHCNIKSFTELPSSKNWMGSLFLLVGLISVFFFTGCQKETVPPAGDLQSKNTPSVNEEGNFLKIYEGLTFTTLWELQQARAATARYRHIDNAIRDGYADIAVDVEGMGHHFMKTSIVDEKFDIRAPEILVYNRNGEGIQELVAVEYAVPLSYPKPEGFTGPADVWNGTSGFPFWLLHAWVWAYNPDGVFNWTNAQVHLH